MNIETLKATLDSNPASIDFSDVMALIDEKYDFKQTSFSNGGMTNEPGQNNGSCKLFAFAQLEGLSEQQTLLCFGKYYHEDVLGNPNGVDHQNIRNFMQNGWAGISFGEFPLTVKV